MTRASIPVIVGFAVCFAAAFVGVSAILWFA